MHILLLGSGGREHAMAWKLSVSPSVKHITVMPGSDAIALEDKVDCIGHHLANHDAICDFARDKQVDLVIVGPEAPLVEGIVDRLQALRVNVLGPTASAAQLEGSKEFAKDFMTRHGIPTASYRSFTDADAALEYIANQPTPIVVKADGLAAGKGVVVAQSEAEARAAIDTMLGQGKFGAAGARVVIEAFLAGEEASFIALCDGKHYIPFATSQDHKARDDGDHGPNTGGMGAYSPAPVVTSVVQQRVEEEIVKPTLAAMEYEGHPFRGFLYVGLMIDAEGAPRVVEYNVRLGDPETQPLMMRLQSDFALLCLAAAQGRLAGHAADWSDQAALGVVLAGGAYPTGSSHGEPIDGLVRAQSSGCRVFHAGTRFEHGQWVSAGGRVLCVTALGKDIAAAQELAYRGVDAIRWDGHHHRRDIGRRALGRDKTGS